MKTVIIVLNWNNWEATLKCVQSLRDKVLKPGRAIVVVDNNSSDESGTHLGRHLNLDSLPAGPHTFGSIDQRAFFLQSPVNCGYAGGNNLAIRHLLDAGCDFDSVWIVNNDTLVRDDALTPLQSEMASSETTGFVGSILVNDDWHTIQCVGGTVGFPAIGLLWSCKDASHFQRQFTGSVFRRTPFITGASMLVSRAVIEAIGLMKESYFLYYEEVDWQLRGLSRGFDIRIGTRSVLSHAISCSVGHKSDFFYFVFSRSCVLFVRDNYGRYFCYISIAWLLMNCLVKTRSWSKVASCWRGARYALTRSEHDLDHPMFRKIGAAFTRPV